MENYIDLINFSQYSLGSGMLTTQQIVENAKNNNRNYASITDTNTLSGVPEFMELCNKENIKPIVGVTLSTKHNGNYIGEVTLISKNQEGFNSLKKKVASLGVFNNDLHRTIELKDILSDSKDLLMIEGGKNSIIQNTKTQEEYNEIFGLIKETFGRSLIGTIQPQIKKEKEVELAKKLMRAIVSTSKICKTSIIFSNNNRFKEKSDYVFQMNKMHEFSYLSKRLEKTKEKLPDGIIDKTDMFLPESYLLKRLSDYKTNKTEPYFISSVIIEKIKSPEIFKEPVFPKLKDSGNLSDIIKEKWKTFKDTIPEDKKQVYYDRIKEEMALFNELNFSDYFVVSNGVANNAKKEGQTTLIRGSGAASLVVHMLGLSSIDPVEHDLMFGRFMNKGRVEVPDLDIETSHNLEMLGMLSVDYGKENTANLISFEGLKNAKATTSFVINAYRRYSDQSFDFQKKINRVENLLKDKLKWFVDTRGVKMPTLDKFLNPSDPTKDYNNWVKDFNENKDFRKILEEALKIQGQIHNKKLSVGTVILSNDPVVNTFSTIKNPSEDGSKYIIEIDKNYIQKMGHLKMDVLSSKILYKLNETAKMVNFDINNLVKDMTDPKIYEEISKGNVSHINQIASRIRTEKELNENKRLKQGIGVLMCKEIKPRNYQELTAIMALIRMGEEDEDGEKPAEYKKYLEGRANQDNIVYKHPLLESVLKKTHGAIIFEEQIMRMSKVIANFNDTEADNLRSVIKKKDVEKFEKIKPIFIENAIKNNIDKKVAESIYSDIEGKMGQYQFNEAHACVYSAVAYQQMYMKLNYPAEFYACHYEKELLSIYEQEILSLGFFVQRPDINSSTNVEETITRISTNKKEQKIMDFSLKNMISKEEVLQDILDERNNCGYFEDIIDYSERVIPIYTECNLMSFDMEKSSKINIFKKDTIKLIETGAFDRCSIVESEDLGYIRSLMIENLDTIIEALKNPHIDQEINIKEPEKVLDLDYFIQKEDLMLVVSPLRMKKNMDKLREELKKKYKNKPK